MSPRVDLSPYIKSAADRFGVPTSLIQSVVGAESSGDPNAVGPRTRYGTSARGAMQLMEPTYRELAAKHGFGSDIHDPANNIGAGTAYLRQLYDVYGDWADTVRAYNMGPNAYNAVRSGKRAMPAETVNFGDKVLRNAGIASGAPTPLTPGPITPDRKPAQTAGAETPMRSLLINEDKNYYDGMGGLLGQGQTPSQPPGPSVAMPDVGGRITEILGSLANSKPQPSSIGRGEHILGAMSRAMQPLAATTNRRVGIGEMLGALGAGMMSGSANADDAARAERQNQFAELGNMARLQTYQRTEAQNARSVQAANAYADQLAAAGHGDIASALRGNPALMDEIIKAQTAERFSVAKQTPAMLNAQALGLEQGTPEYAAFIEKHASGGGTNINLNTTENRAANAIAEDRVKRFGELRTQGETAGKMLGKLDQLETVISELGETGPGTPQISKLIGWASQAGIPREQINDFYKQVTGVSPSDPAKIDIANKLVNDFVTNSIKTLGANPTDTDLATLQQAMPSITNQAEANRYIISNVLRPQLTQQRELWNHLRTLPRTDKTLDTLDDAIYEFEERNKPKKADGASNPAPAGSGAPPANPPAGNPPANPPAQTRAGDPPPAGAVPPDPSAVWSNRVGGWVKPDPNRPGKWLVAK